MVQFAHDPIAKRSLIGVKMVENDQEIVRIFVKGAPEEVLENCVNI